MQVHTEQLELADIAKILSSQKANAILNQHIGLRLGNRRFLTAPELPWPLLRWLTRSEFDEVLLSGHDFASIDWQESLDDENFPRIFTERGGLAAECFIKVLFINSFDPRLKFVHPYFPCVRFANTLIQQTAITDARIYDPNLEQREILEGFPNTSLSVFDLLSDERIDIIVQTVLNDNYDLQMICALKSRAPNALMVIGGPHLKTVDLDEYRRALPVDGIIQGDGEQPLLRLIDRLQGLHRGELDLEGILGQEPSTWLPRISQINFGGGCEYVFEVPLEVGHQRLAPYTKRAFNQTSRGHSILPYDMIGMKPYRTLYSQKCRGTCYWCRSPKALPPREPDEVVKEIQYNYSSFDSIHFEDNDIWFDPEGFTRVARGLVDEGLTIKPILVKSNTTSMTPKRADLLRDMGVKVIAYGIESFCDRCLGLLHKGSNEKANHRALTLALERGIKPGINAIWLVPGINLQNTKKFVVSILAYLRRGAYLNLVPELYLGDIRISKVIQELIHQGHFRTKPLSIPGANAAIRQVILRLDYKMSSFRNDALDRLKQVLMLYGYHDERDASVPVQSCSLLRSILEAFPGNRLFSREERSGYIGTLDAILEAVVSAEKDRRLLYEAL